MTAAIELLGRTSSINVRKVLWTCAELDLAIEHDADWGAGFRSTRSPEFLALNPAGLVPVLRHGGLVLSESNTICRYLAALRSRDDLLSSAPAARAQVEQWMDWQATELNGAWRYAFMALVRRSADHRDAASIDASAREWNRMMAILDRRLQQTGAYVVGAEFTLADIVLGLTANRWFKTPIERPVLAAVDAWWARLNRRDAARTHAHFDIP